MMNGVYPFETGEVSLKKKPELPLVWLLPICAFIGSGWLIYRSVSEKGPVITIDFPTAEGLEVDKTKIRYLDVEIGKVKVYGGAEHPHTAQNPQKVA